MVNFCVGVVVVKCNLKVAAASTSVPVLDQKQTLAGFRLKSLDPLQAAWWNSLTFQISSANFPNLKVAVI